MEIASPKFELNQELYFFSGGRIKKEKVFSIRIIVIQANKDIYPSGIRFDICYQVQVRKLMRWLSEEILYSSQEELLMSSRASDEYFYRPKGVVAQK